MKRPSAERRDLTRAYVYYAERGKPVPSRQKPESLPQGKPTEVRVRMVEEAIADPVIGRIGAYASRESGLTSTGSLFTR